ncbi:MAG: GNAT family N-acetyltransferase [Clostridia bacterium]|nr:GNAT family N-acetyltransferase [Clostridia bacterium]
MMEFIRCKRAQQREVEDLYEGAVSSLLAGTNWPQWSSDYPRSAVAAAIRSGEQYAALDDTGQIVGAVMLGEDPGADYSLGSWQRDLRSGEFLAVHALAAAGEARGRGIGRFLLEGCIEEARSGGYRAVRLDIVPENEPARRLYTGRGFQPAGMADLRRGLPQVPLWELFEYNL